MARPSSIDLLPDQVRDELHAWLRAPNITQEEATERTNALLEELGLPERISKSAVNRYSMRMEEVGKRLRESRQVADAMVGRLGAEPQGKVGHLLNEIIRTLAFETVMSAAEGEGPVSAEMLKDLSLAVQRLEQASSINVKREAEIRKQERERAAEAVAKTAKKAGVSQETIDKIRRDVLGMAE